MSRPDAQMFLRIDIGVPIGAKGKWVDDAVQFVETLRGDGLVVSVHGPDPAAIQSELDRMEQVLGQARERFKQANREIDELSGRIEEQRALNRFLQARDRATAEA